MSLTITPSLDFRADARAAPGISRPVFGSQIAVVV
ncbi:hypothetical protein EDF20_1944 [Frigoribacterium sp. PhB116]|nr:hypothetical protein EDF20_1944 [Frigoribacterium sp. PhB116]